jgi:YidC/Oxa1 family membrane protein insertase
VLAFFYALVPSYGFAVIMLTVTVRLVLYPLTAKQARSMAQMQRLQPQIKALQQKYKSDRQRLNQELMEFYKEHQINPLSGCLPLVAQMPIFIALFSVLRNAHSHTPVGSSLFKAFCPDTATAAECKEAGVEGLRFLGMDLSKAAPDASGLVDALPFFILIGLVIVSGYLQSRQMSSLQKGRANPQAQMMGRIMPVFFGLISYSLPAGVVLYFLTSNLWQIGQQAVIFGRMGELETKPAPKGGEGKAVVDADSRPAKEPKPKKAEPELEPDPEPEPEPAPAQPARPATTAAGRSNASKKRKKRKRRR